MLVGERFDVWQGSHVNAERFVISGWRYALGTEHRVLQKYTWAWIVRPMEGRVGVTFTFHNDFLISLILSRGSAMLNTLFIRYIRFLLCSCLRLLSVMLGLGFFLSGLSPIINIARG